MAKNPQKIVQLKLFKTYQKQQLVTTQRLAEIDDSIDLECPCAPQTL